jgi:hypothetical protein
VRKAHPDFSTAALSDRPERVSISLYRVRRETLAVSDGDGAGPFDVRECLRKPLNRRVTARAGAQAVEGEKTSLFLTGTVKIISVLPHQTTPPSQKAAPLPSEIGLTVNTLSLTQSYLQNS